MSLLKFLCALRMCRNSNVMDWLSILSISLSFVALVISILSMAIKYFERPIPAGWIRAAGKGTPESFKFLGYQVTLANLGQSALFVESIGWYFPDNQRIEQPGGLFTWDPEKDLIANPITPCTIAPGVSMVWRFPAESENSEPIAVCFFQRRWRHIFFGRNKLTRRYKVIERENQGVTRHFAS